MDSSILIFFHFLHLTIININKLFLAQNMQYKIHKKSDTEDLAQILLVSGCE